MLNVVSPRDFCHNKIFRNDLAQSSISPLRRSETDCKELIQGQLLDPRTIWLLLLVTFMTLRRWRSSGGRPQAEPNEGLPVNYECNGRSNAGVAPDRADGQTNRQTDERTNALRHRVNGWVNRWLVVWADADVEHTRTLGRRLSRVTAVTTSGESSTQRFDAMRCDKVPAAFREISGGFRGIRPRTLRNQSTILTHFS